MSDDLKKWKSIEERLRRGERELDSLKREMKSNSLQECGKLEVSDVCEDNDFFVIRKKKTVAKSHFRLKTFLGVGVLSPRRTGSSWPKNALNPV